MNLLTISLVLISALIGAFLYRVFVLWQIERMEQKNYTCGGHPQFGWCCWKLKRRI